MKSSAIASPPSLPLRPAATTRWPRQRSAWTTARPTQPLAPQTRTFTRLLLRAPGADGGDRRRERARDRLPMPGEDAVGGVERRPERTEAGRPEQPAEAGGGIGEAQHRHAADDRAVGAHGVDRGVEVGVGRSRGRRHRSPAPTCPPAPAGRRRRGRRAGPSPARRPGRTRRRRSSADSRRPSLRLSVISAGSENPALRDRGGWPPVMSSPPAAPPDLPSSFLIRAPSFSTWVRVSVSSFSISSLHAVRVSSRSRVCSIRSFTAAGSWRIAGSARSCCSTPIVGSISRRWRSLTIVRINSQAWAEVS